MSEGDDKMKDIFLYLQVCDKNKMLLFIMYSMYEQYREEHGASWF